MSRELRDNTGSPVTVEMVTGEVIRSYTISVKGDSSPAGRADYLQSDADEHARMFFHTEVVREFHGRGLAGLLVRTALADTIGERIVVVPACPLFAAHLRKHGDAFLAEGGQFRLPRPADLALIGRAVRSS